MYLISGGFRELLLPIAAHLGIPKDRVFANRMHWQWDDETGMPTKLVRPLRVNLLLAAHVCALLGGPNE